MTTVYDRESLLGIMSDLSDRVQDISPIVSFLQAVDGDKSIELYDDVSMYDSMDEMLKANNDSFMNVYKQVIVLDSMTDDKLAHFVDLAVKDTELAFGQGRVDRDELYKTAWDKTLEHSIRDGVRSGLALSADENELYHLNCGRHVYEIGDFEVKTEIANDKLELCDIGFRVSAIGTSDSVFVHIDGLQMDYSGFVAYRKKAQHSYYTPKELAGKIIYSVAGRFDPKSQMGLDFDSRVDSTYPMSKELAKAVHQFAHETIAEVMYNSGQNLIDIGKKEHIQLEREGNTLC